MIKLNRTTEYALIALSYIRLKDATEVSSAREIAARFNLPFEILAKTLQKLKDLGLIGANYGTKGGYILTCDLSQVTLAHFLHLMEGQTDVVCCATKNLPECEYAIGCSIQPAMKKLNQRFQDFLRSISLEELTTSSRESPSYSGSRANQFLSRNAETHYE